jgi:hypothetical protein
MNVFHCLSCNADLSAEEALARGEFSWPEMCTFWLRCPSCEAGLHILAEDGCLTQIKLVSAPGPDWQDVFKQPIQKLTLRADPSFLHIWAFGRHYEYSAKT